eukprot:6207978-Pleurochrysis_carterae.AAC.1
MKVKQPPASSAEGPAPYEWTHEASVRVCQLAVEGRLLEHATQCIVNSIEEAEAARAAWARGDRRRRRRQ